MKGWPEVRRVCAECILAFLISFLTGCSGSNRGNPEPQEEPATSVQRVLPGQLKSTGHSSGNAERGLKGVVKAPTAEPQERSEKDEPVEKSPRIGDSSFVVQTTSGFNALHDFHISPDGKYALTDTSCTPNLALWEIETGRLLRTFDLRGTICFCSDNRHALVGARTISDDGRYALGAPYLQLLDLADGNITREYGNAPTARDTDAAARSNGGFPLWLWDLSSAQKLHDFGNETEVQNDMSNTTKTAISICDYHNIIVALSSDAQRIAISDGHNHKGTVKVFAFPGDRIMKNLPIEGDLFSGGVTSLAFDHDGQQLALGLRAQFSERPREIIGPAKIRVLDISQEGKEIELPLELPDVECLAFSPDGKVLVAGTSATDFRKFSWTAEMVRSFDAATGQLLYSTRKDVGDCDPKTGYSIRFSSDCRFALSTASGHTMKYWDVQTGNVLRVFQGFADRLKTVAETNEKDKCLLVCGGTIVLWDVQRGIPARLIAAHEDSIDHYEFSPDKTLLLTTGKEQLDKVRYSRRTAKLWNFTSGDLIALLEERKTAERGPMAHFSPNGKYVASYFGDDTFQIWDARNGQLLLRPEKGNGIVGGGFSPDSLHFVSLSESGELLLWNTSAWRVDRELAKAQPGSFALGTAFFSPDGQYVISGDEFGKGGVTWYSFYTGARVRESSHCPKFLDHGKLYLAERALYRTSNGELIRTLEAKTIIPHPDMNHLLLDREKEVLFQDATTGTTEWKVDKAGAGRASFLSEGKYVEVESFPEKGQGGGPRESTHSIVDTETGKCLYTEQLKDLQNSFPIQKELCIRSGDMGVVQNLCDAKTKCAIYSFAISGKDYLTWIPEGYFLGSDFASKNLVHLVKGMETFRIDQFYDRFYSPSMIQAKVLGYKVDAPSLDTVLASSPPPFAEIVSPKVGGDGRLVDEGGQALQTTGEVQVRVRTLDAGGGVKELRLYQNGKRLGNDACVGDPVVQEKTTTQAYKVALVSGDNLLTATAFSNEMIESRPFELIIPYGQPEVKPDLYFLTVGVNTYGNNEYNLRLARGDAECLGKDLPEHAKAVFEAIHAKQLYDDQATKQGILAALAEVAGQAKPSDVFAFYFAGHGVVLEDTKKFYLATHGVSKLSSAVEPGSLVSEGITDQELKDALQKIPALKQVVFLDACHSGTADLVAQAMGASDEVVIKKLSRASGTWVFTAADKQQYALEQTDLGHGLFTYALLKGIAGEADAGARDGYVRLSELETYVADTVQKMATKLNRDQQPKIYKGGDDFSIALAASSKTQPPNASQAQVTTASHPATKNQAESALTPTQVSSVMPSRDLERQAPASGQDAGTGPFKYAGTMGEKIKFHLVLSQKGSDIEGTISYDKFAKPIPVQGHTTATGFIVDESDEKGTKTGVLKGSPLGSDELTGTWAKADGSKILPFVVTLEGK